MSSSHLTCLLYPVCTEYKQDIIYLYSHKCSWVFTATASILMFFLFVCLKTICNLIDTCTDNAQRKRFYKRSVIANCKQDNRRQKYNILQLNFIFEHGKGHECREKPLPSVHLFPDPYFQPTRYWLACGRQWILNTIVEKK